MKSVTTVTLWNVWYITLRIKSIFFEYNECFHLSMFSSGVENYQNLLILSYESNQKFKARVPEIVKWTDEIASTRKSCIMVKLSRLYYT